MFLMKDSKVKPALVKVSASKAYTLDEIEQLAKQWADEAHAHLADRLVVSSLLLWLQEQEKKETTNEQAPTTSG